jgi:hypothetical protein
MASTNSQILGPLTRRQNWLIWTPHDVTQASHAIRSESAVGALRDHSRYDPGVHVA